MTQPIEDRDDGNCYYVCAAKLSGRTIDELITATERLRVKGGTDLDGIKSLFTQAGLGANVRPCGSVAGVRGAVTAIPGAANAFAVAFIRLDGSGHMIIAHRGAGGVVFRDYQGNNIGSDAAADLNSGTSFWVFH